MSSEDAKESSIGSHARLVLQQCMSAKLQTQPKTRDKEAEFVQIDRGLMIYVCFLNGATVDTAKKLVKAAVNARLSSSDDGKLVSILDLPGDVLIIPQATLGGGLKGKVMQYHRNIGKEEGLVLYSEFIRLCQEMLEINVKSQEHGCIVRHGTYGNVQVLSTVTNGPYTHMIEL